MKSNFKSMIDSEKPVLIDFHATWCGPCQTLAPILKNVKQDFGDDLKILKIDVDKNQSLAAKFGVRSVPTMILFKDGKQVWKQAGLLSKKDLSDIINQYQ